MAKSIQKEIVTNQLTLTTAIIVSVAIWVVCFLVRPLASLGETIGAYALYTLIGYLLIVINKSFAIIRLRASFQTIIFLILTSIYPEIHTIFGGNLMAICCLASIFILYNTFQVSWSAGLLFHAFILWGIGCLFVPKMVWLIPYLWYSCYVFRSLNIRSFVASVFGWSIPIGIFTIYDLVTNHGADIIAKIAEVTRFESISSVNLELSTVVMLFYTLMLFLVSATHYFLYSMEEKMQTRSYLQHLIVTGSLLFVLAFTSISIALQLMPMILIVISLLYGHFSMLTNSKWSNIFFIGSLLCFVLVFVVNLLY